MVETVDTSTQKDKTEEEMEELYETSMRNLQEGNIIRGRVIEINGDAGHRRRGPQIRGQGP
jgi:hypothetical protein